MGCMKAAGQHELDTFLWPEREEGMEDDWEGNQVIVLLLCARHFNVSSSFILITTPRGRCYTPFFDIRLSLREMKLAQETVGRWQIWVLTQLCLVSRPKLSPPFHDVSPRKPCVV